MKDFPHRYCVAASSDGAGDVRLDAPQLPTLWSAPPTEFDGPGNRWSPETLLTAAIADCFVLTFRAIARASRLSWIALRCEADGTLNRVDRLPQFTRFELVVRLQVPAGTDAEQASRILQKAEHNCLISNSVKAAIHLDAAVEVVAQAIPA